MIETVNESIEKLPEFLDEKKVENIAAEFGTPTYVYDELTMVAQAEKMKAFPAPYGLTVRYAMKANSPEEILHIYDKQSLEIDASSGYEAGKAIKAGILASRILLTSQLIPDDLKDLVDQGVLYNACSLHQLNTYGELFPNSAVTVRINPGLGSGHSHKTNVGGPSSSFGIWHEQIGEVKEIAERHNLEINRLHTHIGSGSDPKVWQKVAKMSLETAKVFPDVAALDLGGGFKVGRMSYEQDVDLQEIGEPVKKVFENFAEETGRKLKLELEPGTFLTANAGAIISEVKDIKTTGEKGYLFYVTDTGMTENLRPALYGAQHPITIVPRGKGERTYLPAVVVGRACESGDLLTPDPDDPEKLGARLLQKARVGDLAVVGGAGVYCESMSAHGYNSYPRANSILIDYNGKITPVKK